MERHKTKFLVFSFLFFVFGFLLFIAVPLAHAQVLDTGLVELGQEAGYGEASLPAVIGRIVKIILSLLGLAAVLIIIYGGVVWMLSGGIPEKIDKAKKILSAGVIGLLIIISAYAIASFIVEKFTDVTGPPGEGNGEGCPPYCPPPWYPDAFKIRRVETTHGGLEQNYNSDVYLCSAVQPIFNRSVDADVIEELETDQSLRIESDGNTFSGNWQTRNNAVVFKHSDELFSENTSYTAYFPKEILDTGGSLLMACIAAGGCLETSNYFIWDFTTGVDTDDILPTITSTTPIFDIQDQAYPDRNVSLKPVLRINFSEPIDMTTVIDENNQLIEANIWVAKLDGENGTIDEVLDKAQWDVNITDNGFTLSLVNDENNYLLDPFTWYRIHVGNIEDLCSNAMNPAVEWDFQTNDRVPGVGSWNPTGDRSCPDTNISVVFATAMWDYTVQMAITGPGFGQNFTFDMRPSEIGEPYIMPVYKGPDKVGEFKVLDPGEESNNFRVFSFDPESGLTDNSEYNIEILTDLVIDTDGNLLSHNWSFTTATLKDCLCAPWVSYLSPDQGGPGECITINGSCFAGTLNQPAIPSSLLFILGEESSNANIAGYDKNYITTTVPINFSDGERPKVQTTITYDDFEEEFISNDNVEFFVNSGIQATGPCLYSLNPSGGYPTQTTVDLTGDRFGAEDASSQVQFYPSVSAAYTSWSDTQIDNAIVPDGAQTGNVVVINDQGMSNGLPFTVYEYEPPIITDISPDQGTNDTAIPTYVTITGQNFGSRQGRRSVMIGDYEADTACGWTDTKIIAIVPEALDMDQNYDVKIVDPEQGESNSEEFTVNNTFHPAICKLDPNYGKKDDNISVIGTNFGNAQNNSYIDFDTIQISDIDADDWSNTSITISVPDINNVESNVIAYVASPIEEGSPLKASNPAPFYKEPKITSISPDKGPRRTWVTIRGQNFLSSPGTVYFRYKDLDYPAVSLPDYCGTTWTDAEIKVEMPENLPQATGLFGSYNTEVYVKTVVNVNSNTKKFKINNDPLGPALCSIDPESVLQKDIPTTTVTIKGKRFNFDPDDLDDFERKLIFSKDQEVSTLTWLDDSEISSISIPQETMSGDVVVEKEVFANCRLACDAFQFGSTCFGNWVEICDRVWTTSNPVTFEIQCTVDDIETQPCDIENGTGEQTRVCDANGKWKSWGTCMVTSCDFGFIQEGNECRELAAGEQGLPYVVEDRTCETANQSPSPWKDYAGVCINAGISAQFNEQVSGLDLNNIIVEQCNTGRNFDDSVGCSIVNGSIQTLSNSFIFTPTSNLSPAYWYRVTLRSDGITDTEGNKLNGNKNNKQEGSPADDYVWHFKTKDESTSCSAESVLVNEQTPDGEISGVLVKPGTRDYSASAIGPDCQILIRGNDWSWGSSDITVATVNGSSTTDETATAQGVGETQIQATATPVGGGQAITSAKDLIVTSRPDIISTNPADGESGVCQNILISIDFDQVMNTATLSSDTIALSDANGDNVPISISTSSRESIETKKGAEYTSASRGCNECSVDCTQSCSGATWEYEFNFLETGVYQFWVETSNYESDVSDVTDWNEDVCPEFGTQHHIKVFIDGDYIRDMCNDATGPNDPHQVGYAYLGYIDAGIYTIKLQWDNDRYNPGVADSNLRIYQLGIEKYAGTSGDTAVSVNAGLLEKITQYTMVISGGSSGVKNIYGVTMDTDYSFVFTTGDEICQPINSVEISPNSVILTEKGETVGFTAYAKDKNGNNIIGIENVYDWSWSWLTSDETIATIANSANTTETATAQQKNGTSSITATATIIDDFVNTPTTIDKTYSRQALVQVFLCENPLWFIDQYNQELFYCRDKDPELLPSLPIPPFQP